MRVRGFGTGFSDCNKAADSAAPLITLGNSSAPLNGPWKFQIGDSPIDPATGKPLWAEPGLDDSSWEAMDLTPQATAAELASAAQNFGQEDDITVLSVTRTTKLEAVSA